jgi:serine/threonine protein phosphatase PrpC
MNAPAREVIRETIRKSRNPVATAKSLLLDEYSRTEGVSDIRVEVTANFEFLRSVLVQAVYERLSLEGDRTGWLEAGRLDVEAEEAEEMRWHRMRDGIGYYLKNLKSSHFDEKKIMELAAIDEEAVTYKRFLGSYRQYVPGVGYAVSVRKRSLENQDSFLIYGDSERKVFSVADGCGSDRFAAIASHLGTRELARRNGITRTDIVQISNFIAETANPIEFVRTNRSGLATSTITVGITDKTGRRVLKVGDSIAFASYEGIVERLELNQELLTVIGYPGLQEYHVEHYGIADAQLILTSDGLTNYCPNADFAIAMTTAVASDPVIVGEKLLRSALRNNMDWGHSDDITIVVEEKGDKKHF